MRKLQTCAVLLLATLVVLPGHADEIFEIRMYHAKEGKLEALHERFRSHMMKLFEKHGMHNVAYWNPAEKPDTLISMIAHWSREAAKTRWASFIEDPEWRKVYQASIVDGQLVGKIDSVFMTKTHYSP